MNGRAQSSAGIPRRVFPRAAGGERAHPPPPAGCAGPGLSCRALGAAGPRPPPLHGCDYRCEQREGFPGGPARQGPAAGSGTVRAPGRGPVAVPVPPPEPGPVIGRGTRHSGEPGPASGGGRKRRPRCAGRRERRWARPRPSIRATSPNGPSLPPPPPPLGRIVPRPPCM